MLFRSEYSNSVAVDLNAITPTNNDVVLRVKLTNGSTIQTLDKRLKLSYAFDGSDLHATPARLRPSAKTLFLQIPSDASGIAIFHTDKITMQNRWIHVWIQHDQFSGSVSLDVDVIS